ncbi:MAG: methylmalonyl-CoA epimerase [Robiginitomaculum sp.]|nr:methylmalonyl-CoA epimerase [Robiginitomaculum sp.]
MMIGRINHIGIATKDVEKEAANWATLYGAIDAQDAFDLPEQGVRVKFINLPNGQLELIAPLGENSPITKFLERNPSGGQHHICFEVEDITIARDDMISRGAKVLGNGSPRIGAHGVPVIFIHPANSGGVLVELMQQPKES